MRRRFVQLGVLLVALVGTCCLAHAAEAVKDGDPARLMGRLQELIRQLRELRQDYYTQKAQDVAEMEAARRDCDLLKGQVADLREQEASLDAALADYRSQIQQLETELEEKAILGALVEQELNAFASAQVRQIEAGIPYRQLDRLARLRAASPEPNEATVSVAERLGHLWSYAQEELRLAESSETYTERASVKNDALPYARYLRVGQLLLGYVTEDGEEGAVWLNLPEAGRWQAIADPKQLAQLRDAAEILDRRQAPRFVSLPIILDDSKPEKKSP